MTLPTTTILPLHTDKIRAGGEELESYMKELVFTLQRQYEDMAQAINGSTLRSTDAGNVKWSPVLKDDANSATTFTYDHQIGTVLRKGLMVDVWFDVSWSANSGAITGNMTIDLPYKVALIAEKPFVGIVQASVFTFSGGTECVINAIPDSYTLEVWNTGDAFTTAQQGSASAGQLIGYIIYVGQGIERS
jgi:hypothetical protein